jgi:hypothetical protein
LETTVTQNSASIQALEVTLANTSSSVPWSDLEIQMAATATRLDAVEAAAATRVGALESATAAFESWRPFVEAAVDDIKYSVEKLCGDFAKSSAPPHRLPLPSPHHAAGVLGPNPAATERPSATACKADGPHGHRMDHHRRESGFGHVFAQTHLPPNGMADCCFSLPYSNMDPWHDSSDHVAHESPLHSDLGKLPRLNFPCFDGENPKLWQRRCEDYFMMYAVSSSVWIRVATMHFSGAAARWWQSVEHQLGTASWVDFVHMLRERFWKDQHALLVRQLFHIKQQGSVVEYVDQFAQLVDQLNTYQTMSDPLYYTMKFLDGLRFDIKSMVMIQRPKDLDTAYVLAQLQEEIVATSKKHEYKKLDSAPPGRSYDRGPLPLPPPPKSGAAATVRPQEHKSLHSVQPPGSGDRLASVYAYRKAQGLCYKCGSTYTRGHQCPDSVQLHFVEELWDQFPEPSAEKILWTFSSTVFSYHIQQLTRCRN